MPRRRLPIFILAIFTPTLQPLRPRSRTLALFDLDLDSQGGRNVEVGGRS